MSKTLEQLKKTVVGGRATISEDSRFLQFLAIQKKDEMVVHVVRGEPRAIGLPSQASFTCSEFQQRIDLDTIFTEILGTEDYLRHLKRNFHPEASTNVFLLPIKREDAPLWLLVRVYPLGKTNEGFDAFGGEVVHIHENEPFSMTLYKTAHTDDPTGLYNREALRQHIMRLKTNAKHYAMFIDMDDFKEINDLYGHYYGDRALEKVAKRLKKHQRKSLRFYRIGGDEFFVVMRTDSHKEALEFARDLTKKFQNIELGPCTVHLTASIGVIPLDSNCMDFDTLLQISDEAMYEAKRNGKGNVVYKK